mgnify:CR=1 FL=1
MKRNAPRNPKVDRLMRALGLPRYAAAGLLEWSWHHTAEFTPTGDITKHWPEDIATVIGWDRPAAELEALVETGWVDRKRGRVIIHDWAEHADDSVHRTVARKLDCFADGSAPKLGKLDKAERDDIAKAYENTGKTRGKSGIPRAARGQPVGAFGSGPKPKPKPAPSQALALAEAPPLPAPSPSPHSAPPEPDADPPAEEGEARGGSSSSSSFPSRIRASVEFEQAIRGLYGVRGDARHPQDSAEYRADRTRAQNLWAVRVWPEGEDADIGRERFAATMRLVRRAQAMPRGDFTRGPMAWLIDRINRGELEPEPAGAGAG